MKRTLICCLLTVLVASGCRKKSSPSSEGSSGSPAVPGGDSSKTQTPAGAFVPPLAVPPDSPAAKAQTELDRKLASGNPQMQVQVLDELLQAWAMSNPELPKDLEDFVRTGMLTKLPTPPPGKRFLIDRKTGRVVLANQ